MRFESIEISNFRQYKSLNFNFKLTSSCDLHIIEGSNGMGKTNILNAIAWCLYGDEPHLGDQSRSLPKLNLEAKNEAIRSGRELCIVSVKIYAYDNDLLLIYERQLPVKVSTDFEQAEVFSVTVTDKSGDSKIFEKDEAKEYVNLYMPEKIREYFYFDGEQLHNYFITDQSTKIKDSIHAVSQVELLTSIKERLGKVILEKQKEAGSKNPDISKLNTAKNTLLEQVEKVQLDIDELKRQISQSNKVISVNSDYLRGQEDVSESEARYQKLQATLDELLVQKKLLAKELNKFLRDYKIILTFYPSVKAAIEVISEKENNGLLPPDIDKRLLENMLAVHKCLVCDNELGDEGENRIKNLIEQVQVSSATSHMLMGIKSDLERIITQAAQYPLKKDELFKKNKKLDNDIKEVENELAVVDKKLKSFSDKEKIVLMHEERERHKSLLETNMKKLGAAEANLSDLNGKLNKIEVDLTAALSKQKECEHISKLIRFAARAQSISEEIEDEMMREVREKIRKRTMYYFSKLIWKKDTYDNIKLDEEYKLDLIHKEGYSCVGSCSAAERSLLALSFTLALHEVSGFNALLFIDTPVARVSDANRENFAKVLRDVSREKQIIMTFAPSEYSDEIKNIFEPVASNTFKLFTEDERVTGLR